MKRVSASEARQLIEDEGYAYVDVRSVPEFEQGHPAGSFNVPILDMGPYGMAPNPDFAAVMEKAFAKDARIVVGCKSGGRSLQAAHVLARLGYTSVVDQRAGFDGNGSEPGWRPAGLPVETGAGGDHSYTTLRSKV